MLDLPAATRPRLSMDIPEGWTQVRLGEVFEQVVDTGHTKELPVLAVTLDRGVIRRSALERKFEREVERYRYLRAVPGDIAYNTMRMWQGGSGLVREEGYLSPAYTICRALPGEHPEFWAYAFKTEVMIRAFKAYSQGFAKDRYRLYFHHFAMVPAFRPPFPAQRKIAEVLVSIDEVINAAEEVIAGLRAARVAALHTLFQADHNASWHTKRLDCVASIQTGIAKGKLVKGEAIAVPYLRVANVQDGFLDLREMKTIKVEAEALERYSLREGDVLFTEGGDADKVGRGCVWRGEVTPCLHQNHVFAVRVNREVLLPEFLSYFGSSSAGKSYFLNCAKQTTNLASINSTQLKALPVPLPPVSKQREIVDIITSVEARLKAEEEARERLLNLKAVLATALFTGQLRVTPDEALA